MNTEKKKKKKRELTRGPNPTRPASTRGLCGAGYTGQFFLRFENINPPRQTVQVMQVDSAGSTRFAISN